MTKFGVIQNEEVLFEVLENGGEFFISCKNRADARSKAVSLGNARNRLLPFQQKQLRVQKTKIGEEWGVKVFPAADVVIWKIMNGERIRWNPDEGRLSLEEQRMFKLMLEAELPLEEMIKNFPTEKEGIVRKLYPSDRKVKI